MLNLTLHLGILYMWPENREEKREIESKNKNDSFN